MAFIRLYLAAITLVFVIAVVATRGIGVLEAVVMTTATLLQILDIREELRSVEGLEKQIAALTR